MSKLYCFSMPSMLLTGKWAYRFAISLSGSSCTRNRFHPTVLISCLVGIFLHSLLTYGILTTQYIWRMYLQCRLSPLSIVLLFMLYDLCLLSISAPPPKKKNSFHIASSSVNFRGSLVELCVSSPHEGTFMLFDPRMNMCVHVQVPLVGVEVYLSNNCIKSERST